MSEPDSDVRPEDIAIVGLACRVPGARTATEFWRNLQNGVESIQTFTDAELAASGVPEAIRRRPDYVPRRGTVDSADTFDAAFFGFSVVESELLDPQQRVLLETAWEALEDAGYDPLATPGRVGVFAGVGSNGYLIDMLSSGSLPEMADPWQVMVASDKDYACTRISHRLNLTGPSVTVQTACSTSLVAVSLGVQSLLTYQTDVVLAGGCTIKSPQQTGYVYQEGHILSPDGHCRAFDKQARGTVIGSGVGVVALKRLADAIIDRDHIYAVIKGIAVNNDGSRKVGYTAPSIDGQSRAIVEALEMADVSPDTLDYVEAHGTGTELGDPIEIAALTKAFGKYTARKGYCGIGSVKTNIGHLDTAAGVVGLIKTALALKHGALPPSLHFEAANPRLQIEESPFYVVDRLKDWPRRNGPRRGAVSSFGIGGTNAHAVLEEAPTRNELAGVSGSARVVVAISARNPEALDASCRRIGASIEATSASLRDVAYTLQVGRHAFEHRFAAVVGDREEAVRSLAPATAPSPTPGARRPLALTLTRSEVDLADLSRRLRAVARGFDADYAAVANAFQSLTGVPLDASAKSADARDCALFAIDLALLRLLSRCGIRFKAAIVQGPGAMALAVDTGAVTLQDALRIVRDVALGRAPMVVERELASATSPRPSRLKVYTGKAWVDPSADGTATWIALAGDLSAVSEWIERASDTHDVVGLGLENEAQIASALDLAAGDTHAMLAAVLASAWLSGLDIVWSESHSGTLPRRVSLPTYPFTRKRFWIESRSREVNADARPMAPATVKTSGARTVFVFSGHGSQSPAMGRQLLEESAEFAAAVERCDRVFSPLVGWSVRDVLRGAETAPPIDRVDVVQAALFTMSVALADTWRALGVKPDAVMGQSLGEVAAAFVAEAITLEEAALIIVSRSRLAARLAGKGAMLAVDGALADVARIVDEARGAISVAVVNPTSLVVLAGDADAIDALAAKLDRNKVFNKRVGIDYASHSRHVDDVLPELAASLAGIRPKPTTIPLCSTVTGEIMRGDDLTPAYWCRNIREPVRLDLALARLLTDGARVFVEFSGHPVLAGTLAPSVESQGGISVGTLRREHGSLSQLYSMLGAVHAQWRRSQASAPSASEIANDASSVSAKSPAEILQVILRAMSQALHVADVAPDQDFFQLGGDSVIAMQIASYVKKSLNLRSLPVQWLIMGRTAMNIAEIIVASVSNPDGT